MSSEGPWGRREGQATQDTSLADSEGAAVSRKNTTVMQPLTVPQAGRPRNVPTEACRT